MDFHAAIETFAEAWVAANTPTAVNSDKDSKPLSSSFHEPPTMLPKEKLASIYGQKSAGNPSIYGQKSSGNTSIYGHPSSRSSSPDLSSTTSDATPPPVPVQTSPSVSPATKSLPIHVIIEQTSAPPTFEGQECGSPSEVELDSYAILPCNTLFCDLVRSALVKLGYTSAQTVSAKGAIQIKNWQPLSFDVISTDKKASIEDILGELTQVATLRIRLCSLEPLEGVTWNDTAVRNTVIMLLKDMSQSKLASISPLTQSTISNIANWKYNSTMSRDKCIEFGEWYKKYTTSEAESTTKERDSRITFHPELEVPKLRKWFEKYPIPTERQLQKYATKLNDGHVRQDRPKVTVWKLKIWWKNERQREKRIKGDDKTATPGKSHSDNSKSNVLREVRKMDSTK